MQSGEAPLGLRVRVRGLAALLPTLAVAELDAVLLGALQRSRRWSPRVGLTLLDDAWHGGRQQPWPRRPCSCGTAGRTGCASSAGASGLAPDSACGGPRRLPPRRLHVYLQGRTQGAHTPTGGVKGGWGQPVGPRPFPLRPRLPWSLMFQGSI